MEWICRSSIRFGLLTAALLAAAAPPARSAERYPTKPIRLIAPFPPGGSTDFNARAIQDKLSDLLASRSSSTTAAARRARSARSLKRSSALPDLPTVAEGGLPGFEMVAWHIIVAPAGTPAAIIRTLNEKIRATLRDPVILQRFEKGGMESVPTTPSETTAYLKKEQAKWRRVIEERNMKAQ
jgi:tripartite-type tricarboxylate transporter receptor subunit TctC